MLHSDFNTIEQVKQAFGLTIVENVRFFPPIDPIIPSDTLIVFLQESVPLATATGSEKARSELIISPILLEVRKILQRKISLFSGEEFSVDPSVGLNGICDFLISRSPELLEIEPPVVVILEASTADLKAEISQCIAQIVAAQKFNEQKRNQISSIYGCMSSGTQWRFLKLEGQIVTIDRCSVVVRPF